VGENPHAARYAGASAKKAILISFLLGGVAAGLAGASQIIGRPPAWSLYATLGNVSSLGFDGIGVALIGRNHPLGGILAAILYGALAHGGRYMEYQAGVDSEMVRAINGIIIVALSIPELWAIIRRRIKR
jgi:simple sugar transport system permease protein